MPLELDPQNYVRVRITGADGEPYYGVRSFTIHCRDANGVRSQSLFVTGYGDDGVIWFVKPEAIAGKLFDKVSYNLYTEDDLSLAGDISGDSREIVEIALQPMYALTVHVSGLAQLGREGKAQVVLESGNGEVRSEVKLSELEDGSDSCDFLFEQVQRGFYTLTFKTIGGTGVSFDLGRERVGGPGQVITVAIPPLNTVTIIFPESAGTLSHCGMISHAEEAIQPGAKLDDQRQAVFKGLPSGHYTLFVGKIPFGDVMEIEVKGDQTITFEGSGMNRILVRVSPEAAAEPDQVWRDGDLVFAVNGTRFSSYADLMREGMRAGDADSTFTVVRAGQEVEITVPPSVLRTGPDEGVRFVPTHR